MHLLYVNLKLTIYKFTTNNEKKQGFFVNFLLGFKTIICKVNELVARNESIEWGVLRKGM